MWLSPLSFTHSLSDSLPHARDKVYLASPCFPAFLAPLGALNDSPAASPAALTLWTCFFVLKVGGGDREREKKRFRKKKSGRALGKIKKMFFFSLSPRQRRTLGPFVFFRASPASSAFPLLAWTCGKELE